MLPDIWIESESYVLSVTIQPHAGLLTCKSRLIFIAILVAATLPRVIHEATRYFRGASLPRGRPTGRIRCVMNSPG